MQSSMVSLLHTGPDNLPRSLPLCSSNCSGRCLLLIIYLNSFSLRRPRFAPNLPLFSPSTRFQMDAAGLLCVCLQRHEWSSIASKTPMYHLFWNCTPTVVPFVSLTDTPTDTMSSLKLLNLRTGTEPPPGGRRSIGSPWTAQLTPTHLSTLKISLKKNICF